MPEELPPPYHLVGPGDHNGVLLSTANDFPGYEVTAIYGLVYGTYVTDAARGFRTNKMVEGEYVRWREQTLKARDKAANRLIAGVIASGGNAAYAMRFEITYPDPFRVEATCYATAVTIVPKSQTAKSIAAGAFDQRREKA